jgi:tRNA dimethylallyltransferase
MTPSRGICPALVGPTAVGKTDLVLSLAEQYPLDVISLDSRQVYHGLRIGTAQPTTAERQSCPHHLVDFLPIDQTYSAQRFRDDVLGVLDKIRQQSRIPLLVGGAGLYLNVLREGLLEIPGDDESKSQVRTEFAGLTDEEARDLLHTIDPASWDRIPPADGYRTRRALEIERLTGKTMTQWREERRPDPAGGYEYPSVLLERPRDELRSRIAQRTDLMLESGWVEETQTALQEWPAEAAGLRTLGYREITRWLAGEWTRTEARDEIILRTRQYAKRQVTWFRPRPHECAGAPSDSTVRDTLCRLLDQAARP